MDIYSILSSKPHNPHYLNRYITFIKQCQHKNVGHEGYVERHHICPKADDMFPEYKDFRLHPWNCAVLTARQHYIAHLMLWKVFPTESCLGAIWNMSNGKWKQYNRRSKLYEIARVQAINLLSSRMRGNATVKDPNNLEKGFFRVPINDPRYLSDELVGVTRGLCVVEDNYGNRFMAPFEDINNVNIRSIHKDRVSVKDIDGNVYKVHKSDKRYIDGSLMPENKGLILVRDSEGNVFKVTENDERFLTGEVVGYAKGRVNVVDKEGNRFQVMKNDPRILTGEIKHITKDKIIITNGKENKGIEKGDKIPDGWKRGITKKSQKGMICITDGIKNSRIYPHENIPKGWKKGTTRKSTKA